MSDGVNFDTDEKTLLMALQYNFPLSEEPYFDLSDITGLKIDYVLKKTKDFLERGVVKRVGAQLNYKAFREIGFAALVGASLVDTVDSDAKLSRIVRIINSYNPKHNYLRDDERYNIWFTVKEESPEKLEMLVKEIMEKCSIDDYVYLPSKRVYKMDVKYDLFRGISYSEAGIENSFIPKVEEVGIDARLLLDLERDFKVETRPFKRIAQKYGLGEGELISLIEELIELRIIRGFYAVLKERKIGFSENAMNMVETEKTKKVALRLLKNFPEITHLVERETDVKWKYPLYFMIHASGRESIEEIRERASKIPGVKSVKTLYSLKDLKESI